LAALVDLVGTIGPAQVFWEEHSWANKRILPGYRNQYRSGTKLWQDVLRVTTNSFTLFVQALCEQQKKRLAQLRRRLSPMQLEEHSALAAMFCWLVEACVAEQPAMSSDVQHLRQSFINGDHDMMLDLQGLLHEKSPHFSWRDCSALHTAHRNQSARAAAQVTGKNSIVSVDATMLEHSEFALFRQKFEYDLALMEVYRFKVSSQSSLLYHHRLEHIERRRMQASEAVDVMFQNGCPPRFCVLHRKPARQRSGIPQESLRGNTSRRERPPQHATRDYGGGKLGSAFYEYCRGHGSARRNPQCCVEREQLRHVGRGVHTGLGAEKKAFYTRPNLWCWTE
jgi:hypothetical protein